MGLDTRPAAVKVLAADGAGHDHVGRVDNLVDVVAAGLAEALSAVAALVRFVLGVDILVIPKVVLSPECLAAHVAGEGPLVGVRTLVDHEVVGLGELPVAELADEPLLGPC